MWDFKHCQQSPHKHISDAYILRFGISSTTLLSCCMGRTFTEYVATAINNAKEIDTNHIESWEEWPHDPSIHLSHVKDTRDKYVLQSHVCTQIDQCLITASLNSVRIANTSWEMKIPFNDPKCKPHSHKLPYYIKASKSGMTFREYTRQAISGKF